MSSNPEILKMLEKELADRSKYAGLSDEVVVKMLNAKTEPEWKALRFCVEDLERLRGSKQHVLAPLDRAEKWIEARLKR